MADIQSCHFPPETGTARARRAEVAIDHGPDVIIDKPLVNTALEANDLVERVHRAGTVLCATHPYAAYSMIRQARTEITAGALGAVRAIEVSYLSGGLARRLEGSAEAARRWRLDPEISGPSLVLGDIGTHAHHLARFVLGEAPTQVRAELATLVPGRRVHDDVGLPIAGRRSEKPERSRGLCPDVFDGARDVWFVAAAIASNHDDHRWKYCQTELIRVPQPLAGDGPAG